LAEITDINWKSNYWLKPEKDPNMRTWAYRLYILRDEEEADYVPRDGDYIIIAHSKVEADILAKRFIDSVHETLPYVVKPRWGASSEELKGLWTKTKGVRTYSDGKYTKEYEKIKTEHLKNVKVRRPGVYRPRGKEPIFE